MTPLLTCCSTKTRVSWRSHALIALLDNVSLLSVNTLQYVISELFPTSWLFLFPGFLWYVLLCFHPSCRLAPFCFPIHFNSWDPLGCILCHPFTYDRHFLTKVICCHACANFSLQFYLGFFSIRMCLTSILNPTVIQYQVSYHQFCLISVTGNIIHVVTQASNLGIIFC